MYCLLIVVICTDTNFILIVADYMRINPWKYIQCYCLSIMRSINRSRVLPSPYHQLAFSGNFGGKLSSSRPTLHSFHIYYMRNVRKIVNLNIFINIHRLLAYQSAQLEWKKLIPNPVLQSGPTQKYPLCEEHTHSEVVAVCQKRIVRWKSNSHLKEFCFWKITVAPCLHQPEFSSWIPDWAVLESKINSNKNNIPRCSNFMKISGNVDIYC